MSERVYKKDRFSAALVLLLGFSTLFLAACEPAPSMMPNSAATPAVPPVGENTERLVGVPGELRSMEDAGFKIVYVLRRKDGGAFDRQDKRYIADNIPAETNRRILTEEDKAFVLGSNYEFTQQNLEMLEKRFTVEDHSKPIAEINVTANSNANTNANTNAMTNPGSTTPESPESKRR